MSGGELLSPKQVARAIGVSESSLKRWCDAGLIPAVRTAGKHRKLALADVVRFLREHEYPLADPAALGLPAASEGAERSLERGRPRLVEALLAGNEPVVLRLLLDLYMARHPLSEIFDVVIAPAFHEIGDRWSCREAEVYQERHACELILRTLHELRRALEPPTGGALALGATPAGDTYAIPTTMAELVLRECGWDANSLGASIPLASLAAAVAQRRPRLCWLSVSHLVDERAFVAEFASLAATAREHHTVLVVGGRALGAELRSQLDYAAGCETMRQLESLGRSLLAPESPT